MSLLYVDLETFSECDLRVHGTPRYAEDPSTEVTIAQWGVDGGEPMVWDCTLKGVPQQLLDLMADEDNVLVIHNSAFERALMRACWGFELPLHRTVDTMVQALTHGLPGALGKVGQVLGLPQDLQKDKRGAQLIQLFAKPRPKGNKLRRATSDTHPAEWAEFMSYSGQDIVAMRAIHQRLPGWNYRLGHCEHELWQLDQRINDRGVVVDLDLAEGALQAVAAEQKRLKAQTVEATDGFVTSPSRRDQLLAFILAEHGVDLPDMKADTLRRRLEDPELSDPVKLLLSLRLESTKTSTAKYKTMVNATSRDGRLRNTLQFAGANRTARWAGRMVQLQNMPRPTEDVSETDIAAIKAGVADVVCGNVMQLSSNAIRGCIVAPPGKKLVVADLANIEGRGLAYLAGEDWKIKAFREYDEGIGSDLYNLAYARSFNVKVEDIPKGGRQIGKVQELGLGYQGGVSAFLTFAAVYNMDLDVMAKAVWASADKEALKNACGMYDWVVKKKRSTFGLSRETYIACEYLKAAWRTAHPMTSAFWSDVEDAVRQAIMAPGEQFRVRQIVVRKDGNWLRVRLPSGRYLCYLSPKVEDGQITYMGISQYTRQWVRLKTYGGKLVENIVQAWARDVLAYNMPTIDASGYEIVLTVHDELLTETPDTDDFSSDSLAALMSRQPTWAPGVPLAAAGFETYRYRKD